MWLLGAAVVLSVSYANSQGDVAFAPPPSAPFPNAPPTSSCQTLSGRRCIFPFKYRGKTYRQCTLDNSSNRRAWCAYRVGRDGITAVNGEWEDCDTSTCSIRPPIPNPNNGVCRTNSGPAAGRKCVFPFRYQGKTYRDCAEWKWRGPNNGRYWCSTKTTLFGRHIGGRGNYGFCNSNCPLPFGPPSDGGFFGAAADAPPEYEFESEPQYDDYEGGNGAPS